MKEKLIFKPRSRLLLQLGDQLIRNESIALLELIKNSYDADASVAKIIIKNVDNSEEGEIIIEDNGYGMTPKIIKNVWMEPGSDYKDQIIKQLKRTPKFSRLPLGEKGIGRFAVHKLGNIIELITKAEGHPEVYLKIDWNIFKKSGYLDEFPVEIIERDPVLYKNTTGTKIIVKKLKKLWSRGMIRDVYRSVNSFCSPFDSPDSFRVTFDIDKKEWLKGLLSLDEIKESALFKFHCEIDGEYINKFRYEFTPWETMTKLSGRVIDENDENLKNLLRMVNRKGKIINLNEYQIGTIKFEALIFDRDPRILKLGIQDKRGLCEYLNQNGGVRVYRDGVRVYDYGEPGNDWLNLDIRRVNIPTKRISNNIIISSISLNRKESTDLEEKTNREGFIENEAYKKLKQALLYTLEVAEGFRYEDKDKIRTTYGLKSKKEPVMSGIKELRGVIEKRIKEKNLKKEITVYLDRIEKDYENMKEILLRSAGAGLSLSIVIHEIEKMIDELQKVVKYEKVSDRIIKLVQHLARLIEGYTLIIRKSETRRWELKKIINQAIFNMEYRFKVHGIDVIKDYESKSEEFRVNCARNLVVNSIMNILDNSIWWLEYAKIKDKKIFIKISEYIPEHISIIIADNGPGFSLPVEDMIKPFVSVKPDGMGLGLHIASEVMKAHGGNLLFPDPDEVEISDVFKKGAVVVLVFKKEENK
jgi:signal transduction histidine kinase